MNSLKIEVFIGFVIVVLPYLLIVLGLRGTLISAIIGAFLLCYGIYLLNFAKMVFRKKPAEISLDIIRVYRIGISAFAFSMYLLVNFLLPYLFMVPWWLLLFEIIQIVGSLAVAVVLITHMYLFQAAFIQLKYFDNLSKTVKIRYVEITFLALGICWFFSVGGGDFMNFLVLPLFVIYTIVRKVQNIQSEKLGAKLLKRVLAVVSTPKRLFITTLTDLALRRNRVFLGYIVYSCTVLMMLNFRYYRLGSLGETAFLGLVLTIISIVYLSIMRNWSYRILISIGLPFVLLSLWILCFPYYTPLIRFSMEMNVYPKWIPTIIGYFPTESVASLLPILVFSIWILASFYILFLTQIIYAGFRRDIEEQNSKMRKSYEENKAKSTRTSTLVALGLQLSMSLAPLALVWILAVFLAATVS